uniref:Reverse transcriptase Ty1/copia-type domain-containing protein n=1 Tax=Fagus sylvatica TaxID=28930 RepID=A0A2N9IZ37_FAGSY
MIHMVTIKLSSSNYLLWKSQLLPLLESQNLLGHVDGTLVLPPPFDPPTSQTPNPKHLAWKATNQRLLSLLLSSLTEEAMAEVVGLSTSREVWTALENTFSHRSKAREIRLKDDLQLMKRGTRPVTAYARAFKALCDQLHAIGRPVDGTDKTHWQKVLNFFRNLLRARCRQLPRSPPVVALLSVVVGHPATAVAEAMDQATTPPVTARAVFNPVKAAAHHGARSAAWKATTLIVAGNAKIGTSMNPWRTLQKPSTPHAPCLNLKPRIESPNGKGGGNRLMILLQVPPPSDPSPASLELPMPTPAPVAATPMPSHPMLTRAKAGIFKTRHPANLALLGTPLVFSLLYLRPLSLKDSNLLLRTLLGSPLWMKKFKPCKLIVPGLWFLALPTLILWVPNGCFGQNTCLMDLSSASKLALLPKVIHRYLVSTTLTHLVLLSTATTVRVVLSLAVTNKWPLRQLDVKNAFLNGSLTEHVYMEQPPGYIDPRFPHHVCHLKKALYGLKQAPRAWFQRFSSFLLTLGFSCSRADTSLFVFHQQSGIIYLLLYVDDIIITGNNSSLLDSFTHKLHSEFATKDLGSLSYFLGLEASPTPDGLFLSQLKYARDILTRAQLLDSKPVHTPMVVSQHLSANGPLFPDPTLYRSLVGALQYLTITRPDIAHAVNSVSQFLHAPTADHFLAVKRILRYVKGTLHFGLTFRPSAAPGTLVAYSDADWAGCPDTRRSTSGYSIYLGDNLVSWSAKKQPTVSRSSCESEYRALAMTAAELLWLTHLLHDLKVPLPQQPLLLCDNKSAIFLSSNPVSHKRAKHVELDYHFLQELVVAGKLRTQYVPSHLQVADIFTKSVSRSLFEFFRSKLHVHSNPTLSLRGGVEDT